MNRYAREHVRARLRQTNSIQMVTIFTIIFVAIMATAIRRYALYKAQHGAYLADLEQLHASISFPDTIKMVFFLRKFNWLSLILLLVWCFYYLGTQSQILEYTFATSDSLRNNEAAYPNERARFNFTSQREEPGSFINIINTEMKAYLETPAAELVWTEAGVDQDGFVLIPDMHIERSDSRGRPLITPRQRSQQELESWMTIHPNSEQYTSGSGKKLYLHLKDLHTNSSKGGAWNYVGPPEGEKVIGGGTFTTSFLHVQCDSPEPRPLTEFPSGVATGMTTCMNMTSTTDSNSIRAFELWHRWNPIDWADILTGSEEINGQSSGAIKLNCQITRPDLELETKCSETACVPRKMRYLPDKDAHQSRTPFDDERWAFDFFDNYLWSTGEPEPQMRNSTPHTVVERSMQIYNLVGFLSENADTIATFPTMESLMSNFSASLTIHINTYYNLGLKIGLPTPEESLEFYNTLTFKGAPYAPAYRLHWPWITIDYFCGFLLFLAAIWAWWLRKRTLAPDIFGYVSSLTRDNPHVPVEGGSALSGIDRARHMKKVKIRIGDVGIDGDVGRVGIVYLHDDAEVQALSKHRKYF